METSVHIDEPHFNHCPFSTDSSEESSSEYIEEMEGEERCYSWIDETKQEELHNFWMSNKAKTEPDNTQELKRLSVWSFGSICLHSETIWWLAVKSSQQPPFPCPLPEYLYFVEQGSSRERNRQSTSAGNVFTRRYFFL